MSKRLEASVLRYERRQRREEREREEEGADLRPCMGLLLVHGEGGTEVAEGMASTVGLLPVSGRGCGIQ